jgi:DNA-binding NarL/FixJ family response regulator
MSTVSEIMSSLSKREIEIAHLVGSGYTNRQIAGALLISEKTVETYMSRIFKKLEVSSRTRVANLVGLNA